MIAGLLVLLVAAPARADLTGFIGANTTPANRQVRGVALGFGLLVVGFELEYSDTTESTDTFAQAPALGGPGFKRFRPVVIANGAMRRLNNGEIAKNPQYADFSLDQSQLGMEDFYDRMDDVMSPSPLDPTRAMKEAITSLEEQVKVRVTSVENGRNFQNSKRGEATMPDGPAIFETSGAWEDFSTPSRDLRLLIATDVVLGFPDRVARRPERSAMPKDKSVAEVKAELQRVLASELAARKGVPLYTIGLGSPDPARDLELTELLVDDVVFVDDAVRFQVKLSARGFQGQKLKVQLKEREPGSNDPKADLREVLAGEQTRGRIRTRPENATAVLPAVRPLA